MPDYCTHPDLDRRGRCDLCGERLPLIGYEIRLWGTYGTQRQRPTHYAVLRLTPEETAAVLRVPTIASEVFTRLYETYQEEAE